MQSKIGKKEMQSKINKQTRQKKQYMTGKNLTQRKTVHIIPVHKKRMAFKA